MRLPVVKGLAPTRDSCFSFRHPKQMQTLRKSRTSSEGQNHEPKGAEENQVVVSNRNDVYWPWLSSYLLKSPPKARIAMKRQSKEMRQVTRSVRRDL